MTHHIISPQYYTKDRINVTILDVINPAHFVVKETPDLSNASSKARRFLEAEEAMQKYYASVEPCFFQLPLKDAIIVVLHEKKFYRAKVLRILTLSAGHLFKVYLVDYGFECSVPREKIYEIAKDFLLHPFQAVNIKLLGLEPISLVMDKISIMVSYGPVPDWDPSAGIFIKDLQKTMHSAYIEVQGIDDLHIYGRLYLCYENHSIKCINDELVSESFARFNEDCWEKIKKIESFLESSDVYSNIPTIQSNEAENVNLEQVPSINDLTKTETDDGDFRMMFINPIDGKIVAESTFTESKAERLSGDEEHELQLNSPIGGKIVAESTATENKAEGLSIDEERKLQDRLLAQKHFQKLLNKRKLKLPISNSSADYVNNKNLQTTNEIGKNFVNLHDSSHVSSNEVYSPNNNASNKNANYCMKKNEEDLKNSSVNRTDYSSNDQIIQNCKKDVIDISNQNEFIKSCDNYVPSSESKQASFTTESESKTESLSQDQLIAQNRLMKLRQLKRFSVSPDSARNKNVNFIKTSVSDSEKNILTDHSTDTEETHEVKIEKDYSVNKIENSNDYANAVASCQIQSSDKSIQEASKNISVQESESKVISEHMKQLKMLQKRIRLKQMKGSLQVVEKPSTAFNHFEELSVITSCDSSLSDSDSGLNSFSSSPNMSDRVRSCCLM